MVTTVRLSLAEYDAMLASGILDERRHQNIELIHGEMRQMSPPGPMHDEMVNRLDEWCYDLLDRTQVRIRTQSSIGIPELDSAPQPDVSVIRRKDYSANRPQPDDVLPIIEVSDSTLSFDRGVKADLYASAGVKDYWIVNLQDWCIEVYRDPSVSGYREKRTFDGDDQVSPLAFPDVALDVAALFQR